jgi:IS30 family transposase
VADIQKATNSCVTSKQVADRLGLHKATVSRRVVKAIELGYLSDDNKNAHCRQQALRVTCPLSADKQILPTVAELVASQETLGAPDTSAQKEVSALADIQAATIVSRESEEACRAILDDAEAKIDFIRPKQSEVKSTGDREWNWEKFIKRQHPELHEAVEASKQSVQKAFKDRVEGRVSDADFEAAVKHWKGLTVSSIKLFRLSGMCKESRFLPPGQDEDLNHASIEVEAKLISEEELE